MDEENTTEETRPNENRTFSYVQSGQMFVGDTDLIRIEPKAGVSLERVEQELKRDFAGLQVRKRDPNCLYITGKPKF